jgi:hypothetical protein
MRRTISPTKTLKVLALAAASHDKVMRHGAADLFPIGVDGAAAGDEWAHLGDKPVVLGRATARGWLSNRPWTVWGRRARA